MKKQYTIPLAILAIASGVFIFATSVSAQEQSDPMQTLVQKIAKKFGLQESEVKAVFDEERQEHMTKMQTSFEERLTQAVTDGKLTESQKAAIIAKHKEMMSAHLSESTDWKSLTPEQHKAEMEKKKAELDAWAVENNVDVKYLFGSKGMRKWSRHGVGMN